MCAGRCRCAPLYQHMLNARMEVGAQPSNSYEGQAQKCIARESMRPQKQLEAMWETLACAQDVARTPLSICTQYACMLTRAHSSAAKEQLLHLKMLGANCTSMSVFSRASLPVCDIVSSHARAVFLRKMLVWSGTFLMIKSVNSDLE